MVSTHELRSISDDELLRRLSLLLSQSRRVESELVAHIGEVDERRLYASRASSSMFHYATDVLHLSEAEAFLRIRAARASRKCPMLLAMLADGRLHLSAIGKLAPHLTEANCESVLARAVHKSKREIEELVAELSPRPDVPSTVRKLPSRPAATPPPGTISQLRPGALKNETPSPPIVSPLTPRQDPPATRAVVQPLAPARYRIQFTASASFREKIERLTALMRPGVPDGDLAAILEEAVTEKLERMESKRYGKTNAPRKSVDQTDTRSDSRYIPAPIRRAVCDRDSDQCTFIDARGRRCTEREGLEFHHRSPYGRDGDHSVENLCLMCHVHNVYLAELDYGRDTMDKYRRPGRVSEPAAVYFAAGPTTELNAACST
jgi:hypothetical protein